MHQILLILAAPATWLTIGLIGSAFEKAGYVKFGQTLESLAADVPKLLGKDRAP